MRRAGFTLFELLAVLAIITLLMGMILVIPKESDGHRVDKAARELQAVLIQARSLAMRSGATHAVAFHIENAGDGHVLKNFPHPDTRNPNAETGGHWYAIIGPDRSGDTNNAAYVPMLDRDHGNTNRAKKYRCVADFVAGMRLAQVGEQHFLPPGVRFLALSDLDRGHHREDAAEGPTFPRPWYGYFDGGRLYAWGGYDPDVDAAVALSNDRPLSGLCYEGSDGPIPYDPVLDTRVNPAAVYGRISDLHQPRKVGDTDASLPPESGLAGTPRPLLSAYWADAMIVFAPDGHAFWVDSYLKEKLFERAWQPSHIQYRGAADIGFVDAVGGFHLTLARDPDPQDDDLYQQIDPATGQPAWNRFADARAAFDSITPFARVFVAADTGEVLVKPPSHPDCRIRPEDLATKDPYPARGVP